MKEKDIISIIGSSTPSYGLLNALLASSVHHNNKRTPEEREAIAKRRRLRHEEEQRQANIIKNVCPTCNGKLIRGKKDKKNDYKRTWTCTDCDTSHII